MMIRGISEIVLNVHDKQRALAFYRDLLGLEVISPPDLPASKLLLSYRMTSSAHLPASSTARASALDASSPDRTWTIARSMSCS